MTYVIHICQDMCDNMWSACKGVNWTQFEIPNSKPPTNADELYVFEMQQRIRIRTQTLTTHKLKHSFSLPASVSASVFLFMLCAGVSGMRCSCDVIFAEDEQDPEPEFVMKIEIDEASPPSCFLGASIQEVGLYKLWRCRIFFFLFLLVRKRGEERQTHVMLMSSQIACSSCMKGSEDVCHGNSGSTGSSGDGDSSGGFKTIYIVYVLGIVVGITAIAGITFLVVWLYRRRAHKAPRGRDYYPQLDESDETSLN